MSDKKTILIIEDEPKNIKLERDILEVAGFNVLVAEEATTGIRIAEEEQPDLIIMDYQLPGMNGQEAQAILKKNEKTKNIKVVFVTASVTKEEKLKLEDTGCLVFGKPIDTRTFADSMRRIING